jgi:hypothetical protein
MAKNIKQPQRFWFFIPATRQITVFEQRWRNTSTSSRVGGVVTIDYVFVTSPAGLLYQPARKNDAKKSGKLYGWSEPLEVV